MRLLILALFPLAAFAHTMPADQINELASEGKPFIKDCLETQNITEVKELVVFNKTSESMDKKAFGDQLTKDLNLKINPQAGHFVTASLASTVSEKNKTKTTTYDLTMSLKSGTKDSTKEMCMHKYTKKIMETRK